MMSGGISRAEAVVCALCVVTGAAIGFVVADGNGAAVGSGTLLILSFVALAFRRLGKVIQVAERHETGAFAEQSGTPELATPGVDARPAAMVSGIIARRLEELSEVAKSDDHIALREALGLRSEYPRNPAVWAELARRYLAVDEYEQGMRTACTAIALALDTGMNSVAVAMFEEFAEHREHLVLAGRRRARLAEALRACGRGSAADWLMSRPDMFASQARL